MHSFLQEDLISEIIHKEKIEEKEMCLQYANALLLSTLLT